MTRQEQQEYAAAFDALLELMARPERQASAAEMQLVDSLRRKARADLAAAPDNGKG